MAMSKTLVVLGFVVVSMLWAGAMAQSSSSCTTVLISLSPCLNFITGNTSTPSSGCCTQLATVVQSQAQCLCEVLNGGAASLGISVNQTRALALPADCKVTTPAVSQCNKVASPSSSPTGLAASPSPASSGSGITTTTPITDTGLSDGSSNKMSLKMIFSLSVLALCAMFSSI